MNSLKQPRVHRVTGAAIHGYDDGAAVSTSNSNIKKSNNQLEGNAVTVTCIDDRNTSASSSQQIDAQSFLPEDSRTQKPPENLQTQKS